ncbi:MAG: penicillin-binding protein activator LpoB [Chitinivibrionales bacterium]|nr:penicillin-binding protein activator LpoB [Chitinivibrionales bacterium]
MQKFSAQMCILAATLLLTSCGGTKVTRISVDSTTDLSGKWNDTDSRLVAEEMINDCLSRPWYLNDYKNRTEPPTIIVGKVRNKSHEHINVETFIKDLERTLINSGKVEFVANKDERIQLRQEKRDMMAGNAADETVKEAGNETGADLMLIGSINTIADQEGNKRVMFYQVDLELIEILTNKKLWIGNKKIKKYITRSKAKL